MKRILSVVSVCVLSVSAFYSLPASGNKPVRVVADSAKGIWEKMSKPDRRDYMKHVVSPAMEKEFAKFDATKYAKMNCSTCHGEASVKAKSFKMPNPDLPKLPEDPIAFRKKMAEKQEMTSFMMKTVKPRMAELLGLPEMNMKTKT